MHPFTQMHNMQTHTHPQSRKSINIQGGVESGVGLCQRCMNIKETKREGENGRKQQEREREVTMRDGRGKMEESKQCKL